MKKEQTNGLNEKVLAWCSLAVIMPNVQILLACHDASVMELVDMTDSKSVAFGRGGSSSPTGTTIIPSV